MWAIRPWAPLGLTLQPRGAGASPWVVAGGLLAGFSAPGGQLQSPCAGSKRDSGAGEATVSPSPRPSSTLGMGGRVLRGQQRGKEVLFPRAVRATVLLVCCWVFFPPISPELAA